MNNEEETIDVEITDEELQERMDKPRDYSNWRETIQRRKNKLDERRKAIYLRALDLSGRKHLSAEAADVCYQTICNHREKDPEFAEAEAAVIQLRSQRIVNRLEKEFIEGHFEPIVNKDGDVVGERKKLETQARIKVVQRHEEEYRDKQDINMNHAGGVLVAPAEMSPEQWIEEQKKKNEEKQEPGKE